MHARVSVNSTRTVTQCINSLYRVVLYVYAIFKERNPFTKCITYDYKLEIRMETYNGLNTKDNFGNNQMLILESIM